MGSAADTLETSLLKAVLQNITYTAGPTLGFALGSAASDTAFTELPNANGYARAAITMSAANFPEDATIKGKWSNNITITVPSAGSASANWTVTPTVWGLFTSTAYGAGNLLAWASIDASSQAPILSGQAANFVPGAITGFFD